MTFDRLREVLRGDDDATVQRLGRYELVREIGRGGMAVVYEAWDPELKRGVAIKKLVKADHERLRKEATAAARLHHPNIIAVHEIGTDYIVMDLVRGRTLADAAASMALADRVRVLDVVARAVAYAHEQGVVHRDLTPRNILIDDDGRIVLTDFGLAKLVGQSDLSLTAAAVGTPHYMAPEQIRGRGISGATDVWALGVLLCEMVTGKRPFEGNTAPEVYDKVLHETPRPPRGPLGDVARRALERKPENRFRTATAFADDLSRWRAGRSLARTRVRVWFRAHGMWLAGLGALAILGGAAKAWVARDAAPVSEGRLADGLIKSAKEHIAWSGRRQRGGLPPLDEILAAERDIRRALALTPGSEEALYILASLRRERGGWLIDRGRDPGADCIPDEDDRSSGPFSSRLRVQRAWRLFMCARWAEHNGRNGRDGLETALGLLADERGSWAIASRGLILAFLGRYEQSESEFALAARKDQGDTAWKILHIEARALADDHVGAAAAIAAAGDLAEKSTAGLSIRGRAHLAAGRFAEGRADLEKAIAIDATIESTLRPIAAMAIRQEKATYRALCGLPPIGR